MAQPRIALINPNTNAATTAAMVEIARAAAPGWEITGFTARSGGMVITDETLLATARAEVIAIGGVLDAAAFDGVMIAAFADPGLGEVRRSLALPVVGIAEAGMRAAAALGRFSIVTTTGGLLGPLRQLADRYGCGSALTSIRLTEGDLAESMRDPDLLLARLRAACEVAIRKDKVDAIVIGGGPLAVAARQLGAMLPVPVVEPLPAAIAALRAVF